MDATTLSIAMRSIATPLVGWVGRISTLKVTASRRFHHLSWTSRHNPELGTCRGHSKNWCLLLFSFKSQYVNIYLKIKFTQIQSEEVNQNWSYVLNTSQKIGCCVHNSCSLLGWSAESVKESQEHTKGKIKLCSSLLIH